MFRLLLRTFFARNHYLHRVFCTLFLTYFKLLLPFLLGACFTRVKISKQLFLLIVLRSLRGKVRVKVGWDIISKF